MLGACTRPLLQPEVGSTGSYDRNRIHIHCLATIPIPLFQVDRLNGSSLVIFDESLEQQIGNVRLREHPAIKMDNNHNSFIGPQKIPLISPIQQKLSCFPDIKDMTDSQRLVRLQWPIY